jgi:hypothetical protein
MIVVGLATGASAMNVFFTAAGDATPLTELVLLDGAPAVSVDMHAVVEAGDFTAPELLGTLELLLLEADVNGSVVFSNYVNPLKLDAFPGLGGIWANFAAPGPRGNDAVSAFNSAGATDASGLVPEVILSFDIASVGADANGLLGLGGVYGDTVNGSNIAGNLGTLVDSVQVQSVQLTPEPATLALLALGGIAALRRRR